MQCNYNAFIKIINFHGLFPVMLRGAEKLVPAEYWCPYGTLALIPQSESGCHCGMSLECHLAQPGLFLNNIYGNNDALMK